MRQLIYTSVATQPFDTRDLLDLMHEARSFNSIDEITGLLVYRDGCFLQIIEGPSDRIDELTKRLQKDRRHKDFSVLSDKMVTQRSFPDWSMGCANFDDPILATFPGVNTDLQDPSQSDALIQQLLGPSATWQTLIDS